MANYKNHLPAFVLHAAIRKYDQPPQVRSNLNLKDLLDICKTYTDKIMLIDKRGYKGLLKSRGMTQGEVHTQTHAWRGATEYFSDNSKAIYLDLTQATKKDQGELLYTLFHEIGHTVLHHYEANPILARLRQREFEANNFAYGLMKKYRGFFVKNFEPQLDHYQTFQQAIIRFAHKKELNGKIPIGQTTQEKAMRYLLKNK